MEQKCQALTGKGSQCSRKAVIGPYCTQHKKYVPPPLTSQMMKNAEKAHKPPKIVKPILARYEASMEKIRVSVIPKWFMVDEWDTIWNSRSFSFLGKNIVEKIIDLLSPEDCLNFGSTCRENRRFSRDETYWKRRYEKYLKPRVWLDGEQQNYREKFYQNYIMLGYDLGVLKDFSADAIRVLKKVLVVIYRKCLMCPIDSYVEMLDRDLILAPKYANINRQHKAKIIDIWHHGKKENSLMKHSKAGLVNYITGRLMGWFRRTYEQNAESKIKEVAPYFIYEFFSHTPVFECVKPLISEFNYDFERYFGVTFIPYQFESNDIDGKYANLDPNTDTMTDYDRGLLAIMAIVENFCEPHWGMQIMKRKGRRFECLDDMEDCYCCGDSHVVFQVMKNLLEASPRKETFDDLLTAIELEDMIVEDDGDGKPVTIKSLYRDP